jgi:hypothetical protein
MTAKSTSVPAALMATLVLALAVGSASANRLSYSNQAFRIIWTRLTFSESGGGIPISCPVTLEGSFHERTLAKTRDALVAHITAAAVDNARCQEGHATILEESLPWHVLFASFSGTLPSITSVRHLLIGAAFQVEPGLGVVCLAETSTEHPAAGEATREAGGNITSLIPDSLLSIPTRGELCPSLGIFAGSGQVYVQGSTERRVSLTLI